MQINDRATTQQQCILKPKDVSIITKINFNLSKPVSNHEQTLTKCERLLGCWMCGSHDLRYEIWHSLGDRVSPRRETFTWKTGSFPGRADVDSGKAAQEKPFNFSLNPGHVNWPHRTHMRLPLTFCAFSLCLFLSLYLTTKLKIDFTSGRTKCASRFD